MLSFWTLQNEVCVSNTVNLILYVLVIKLSTRLLEMLSTYRTCIALIEKPNKTPSYLSFEITGPEVCAIWYTETEVNLYKKTQMSCFVPRKFKGMEDRYIYVYILAVYIYE